MVGMMAMSGRWGYESPWPYSDGRNDDDDDSKKMNKEGERKEKNKEQDKREKKTRNSRSSSSSLRRCSRRAVDICAHSTTKGGGRGGEEVIVPDCGGWLLSLFFFSFLSPLSSPVLPLHFRPICLVRDIAHFPPYLSTITHSLLPRCPLPPPLLLLLPSTVPKTLSNPPT